MSAKWVTTAPQQFTEQNLNDLASKRILMTAPGCASQQAVILVDDAGERTVLWKRDNRLTLQPEELQREWIVNARALHVDGHDTAAAVVAAGWAREAGVPVIADLDDLYPGVEALIEKGRLPDHEPRHSRAGWWAKRICADRCHMVRNRFGCRLAAATLGHEGVLAWDGSRFHYAPPSR